MTSRNFYSNARLARRLLGGLADVDKLGLDRGSTDEEPIDIGLLGYKSRRSVKRKQEQRTKSDQPHVHPPLGNQEKKREVDQD